MHRVNKVPVVAHPVPVAIPTAPSAGQPFPSFVTGAPTAYVIPTTAMLQPMIPGPAFYSLTSLPALHASGMPPPVWLEINHCWKSPINYHYICSTSTTPIICIGLPIWPACPFLGLIIRKIRRKPVTQTTRNGATAAGPIIKTKTNRKRNQIVRNSCRSEVFRLVSPRLTRNRWHNNNNNNNYLMEKAWSVATSTLEWIAILLKNLSYIPWPSSSRAASRAAAVNVTSFKQLYSNYSCFFLFLFPISYFKYFFFKKREQSINF